MTNRITFRCVATIIAVLGQVTAIAKAEPLVARPPRVIRSPADLYGPLFHMVQMKQVFPDGKTFVDATARVPTTTIMAAYRREQPRTRQALRTFVERYFTMPGDGPATVAQAVVAKPLNVRAHIRSLWQPLTRPAFLSVPGSSAIALPAPYVVPGGRFREMYYWDSYFTMLGLRADGRQAAVEGMLNDFVSLIERYGHIPNGTRTYYLSRSQPPFFALMLDLSREIRPAILRRRLVALRREHAFWMAGAACASLRHACQRVVRLPNGSLLNRYWDDRDTPRDESYREDVEIAKTAAGRPNHLYRDLRAGAESGWDYSSRWLRDPAKLNTIHTTDIVPVDLNSLLWSMEKRIAVRCRGQRDLNCARRFDRLAENRSDAMRRFLWVPAQARFADWDDSVQAPTPLLSAAALYPLFTGWASRDEAFALASTVRARLLADGGLATTTIRTGQQWDRPNGWAPLQWIAVDGLRRYGHSALADDITSRWLASVERLYAASGKLVEKYDIDDQRPGGGGEYPLQDGFGWTNGVVSAMLAD